MSKKKTQEAAPAAAAPAKSDSELARDEQGLPLVQPYRAEAKAAREAKRG